MAVLDYILAGVLIVAQFLPSYALCSLFVYFCRERTTAFTLMAVGTFLGFLLAPSIESVRDNQIWLDDFLENRIICALCTGTGTLMSGLMAFAIDQARNLKR